MLCIKHNKIHRHANVEKIRGTTSFPRAEEHTSTHESRRPILGAQAHLESFHGRRSAREEAATLRSKISLHFLFIFIYFYHLIFTNCETKVTLELSDQCCVNFINKAKISES